MRPDEVEDEFVPAVDEVVVVVPPPTETDDEAFRVKEVIRGVA